MDTWENHDVIVVLKRGRDKSLRNRHPWLFSGAIARVEGQPAAGDVITVVDYQMRFLGKGFFNPKSQIRVRMLTFEDQPVNRDFFRERLREAVQLRHEWFDETRTNAYRLVHSEGDRLPGLIADRYQDYLVVQFNTAGMYRLRGELLALLEELLMPRAVLDRSDLQALTHEGVAGETLPPDDKLPDRVEIIEEQIRYWVDIKTGQKTGFFLDQRDNRRLIREVSAGKHLLNCFSYSGGFSLAGATVGATTVSVDISEAAIGLARDNFQLNDISPDDHHFAVANVFEFLRGLDTAPDVIVLDPPAFVKNKAHLEKGARGYKDINRLAMQKIAPGGYLLTCSCSGLVDWRLFQQIVFAAASEARRQVQIVARPGQPVDHPVDIYHPEGEYLKTFLLRVL